MKKDQILAIRLREYDRKKGFTMRTYTSACGKKFTAGHNAAPSSWRTDITPKDVNELSEFPQFEIRMFDSIEELEAMVQYEMEQRARTGLPAVRAPIEGAKGERRSAGSDKRNFGAVVNSAEDLTVENEGTSKASSTMRPRPQTKAVMSPKEMTKKDLLAEAEVMGLKVDKRAKKDDIAKAIAASKAAPTKDVQKKTGRKPR